MPKSMIKHTKFQGHLVHTIYFGGEGSNSLSHRYLPPVLG